MVVRDRHCTEGSGAKYSRVRSQLGVSQRDRLRNDDIRLRNDLGIYNPKGRIKQYRHGWTDSIQRMNQDR